jgi:hypothetical protein
MFEREDDPMAPVFPAEPMPPQPARVRPRLPKLRGTTLEAIALWTMACAEQADREALQWDAERVQFKGGAASAYRTVARRLLRLLTEASLGGRALRFPGRRPGLAEHILDAVRTGNHASINGIAQALRSAGRGARREDLYLEVGTMLADGRLVKVDDVIRPAARRDA